MILAGTGTGLQCTTLQAAATMTQRILLGYLSLPLPVPVLGACTLDMLPIPPEGHDATSAMQVACMSLSCSSLPVQVRVFLLEHVLGLSVRANRCKKSSFAGFNRPHGFFAGGLWAELLHCLSMSSVRSKVLGQGKIHCDYIH